MPHIAVSEVLASSIVCFMQWAQIVLPGMLLLAQMQALRHEEETLLPLPSNMWEETDRVGIFRIMQGCEVDVAKAVVAGAPVQKLK